MQQFLCIDTHIFKIHKNIEYQNTYYSFTVLNQKVYEISIFEDRKFGFLGENM